MAKLTIDNSSCWIEGLDRRLFDVLREELSYKEDASAAFFSGRYGPRTCYLISKRTGEFPTGLLYIVRDFLNEFKIFPEIVDKRVRPVFGQGPSLFREREFTPYVEQDEAAAAVVDPKNEGRGIIVGPTGIGKSLIGGLVCDAIRIPTLYVVPSLELKRQATEDFVKWFGADKVGPLKPNGQISKLFTIENIDAIDPEVEIENINAALIDEFHHSGAHGYRERNRKAWKRAYFRIGQTATPFRSKDSERLLLESVLSKVIYEIPYQLAVAKGYIVPMEVYYYELPVTKIKGNPKSYPSVYSELVVNNDLRNKLLAHLMANLNDANISTLCLVKQVEHGRILQADGYPFATGVDEDSTSYIKDFCARVASVLVGTVGVIGEGVDTKPAEYVLLAGGGKSKNQFMQNCGRGFRKYPGKESCKIIMIYDPSHKWLVDHFKQCKKYLKQEYGVAPVKLELPAGL